MVLDAKKKKEKLTHFDVTWKCLKIISVFFFATGRSTHF